MGLVYSEPVVAAAYSGDLRQLQTLLQRHPQDVNIQDSYSGDSPLIAACRCGDVRTAHFLLERGADPAQCNKKLRSPLHYVCRHTLSMIDFLMICVLMPLLLLGYFLMLQKHRNQKTLFLQLLQRGADANTQDYKGNTALHYLCLRMNQRLLPELLSRTDLLLRNHDGETALDVALRLKAKNIIRLFQKYN
ncbi:unnamed protein product [Knipowitschia caucasica]|uniref:Ankyrin repeat domain-containing protein 22 n=1 Tax=Knipowitschia caucasica TaxID=637954 RepID=A0AAV2LAV2_KNICA